jgi:2-dehydropantoate 2-reductase
VRIAIMGSGGIGGMCGARLAADGNDVLFIARGSHLAMMRHSGLRLESALGDVSLSKVNATDDVSGQDVAEIVLFTVKGPDTEAAIELISPIVGTQTGIICFQNGVEGIDKLASRFGKGAVLPGATIATAVISAPGFIRHAGTFNNFTFGEWDGKVSPRAQTYCELAERSGLATTLSESPLKDVWLKYATASGAMSATCLSRLPLRTCVERPETLELFKGAMNEVIALAKARGVELPAESPDRIAAATATIDPAWKTSMLTDLEAGKVIEVEAMFGAAHRMGKQLGIETPILSVAYRALKHFGEARS